MELSKFNDWRAQQEVRSNGLVRLDLVAKNFSVGLVAEEIEQVTFLDSCTREIAGRWIEQVTQAT